MTEEVYTQPSAQYKHKKPSRLWYLAPIFLGIIGGLVAYIAIKDEDKKMAKKMLIIGLVMIFVWMAIGFLIPVIAYMSASNSFMQASSDASNEVGSLTGGIKISFSIESIIYRQSYLDVAIRNTGANDIDVSTMKAVISGRAKALTGIQDNLPMGRTASFKVMDSEDSCGKTLSLSLDSGTEKSSVITCQ